MFKKLLLIGIMAIGNFTAFAGDDTSCKEIGKNALIAGLSGYISYTELAKHAASTYGYRPLVRAYLMLRRPSFAAGCLSGGLSAAALVYTVKEASKCIVMMKSVRG